ncbi:murein transglycosylase A [Sphaerotilus microaerophilus]|jgi:membrane-bound lytic murein transglycosylase A|nr:MltA domain-containing protein [Sphaerotilus sp. FB-5]
MPVPFLHRAARHGPGPFLAALLVLALLAGCASKAPRPTPVPEPTETPPVATPAPPLPSADQLRLTGRGRWIRSDWAELPGWSQDTLAPAWAALLRSCERQLRWVLSPAAPNGQGIGQGGSQGTPPTFPPAQVAASWAPTCRAAIALGGGADERQIRDFLQSRLQPWRVENAQGQGEGLLTGYFEPLLEASRQRSERFGVALHAPPADLAQRRPWYTRAQIDSLGAAQAALAGREIAWVADPMEALMLHIQGSGRLVFTEPNGTRRMVRIAYAGHNDQPYQSVGRWLVDQGAFTLEQASWPAIRAWARANPQRVREMLAVNPRYVFFREEPLPDPTIGALGAQGVPLTPGRSIAVDRESIPYGSPVWLASTEPQPWQPNPPPARPMQRLVVAQDTGSAIVGAVRADLFWGWGEGIEDRAGRTKQPLRLWVLWPR